jgi:sodium/proline symporter
MYGLIPGFLFSSLAILMFSKIGSAPTADMRHEFEMAKRG